MSINTNQDTGSLRTHGEEIGYTEEMIQEFVRCKNDIAYFAETYFYIVTQDRGKEIINLWDFQKNLLKVMETPPDGKRHLCVLSSRQSAKTTTCIIFMLHYALFNEDKTVAILANKESTAIDILKRVKLAYENLPRWLQQGISRGGWNKKTIEFENGSKLRAASTSSSALRGISANVVLLDEYAFVPDNLANEFMASVYPIIVQGSTTKIIMVSCVTEDTYVFTNKGLKKVKDFILPEKQKGYIVDNYTVQGKNGTNTGNIMFNNGMAETNIIKTTSSVLECSTEHKLWACKNGNYGWYKSKELTTDDYISIKYGTNIWGNNDGIKFKSKLTWRRKTDINITHITPDLAYFFGLFIAEGYARKITRKEKIIGAQITITCGDDISDIFKKLNLTYVKYDKFHYTINSLSLLELLEHIGFDIQKKAKTKIIPSRLLEMSKENIIAMLQGLFDGDGGSRKDRGYINYTSTSKELTLQIRMLLLNLGILTDYQMAVVQPTKKVKVISITHTIAANRHNSSLFYQAVGFRINRKNIKQNNLTTIKRPRSNGKDVIPYSKTILIKHIWRNKKLKLWAGVHNKKSSHFSREHLLKLKNDIVAEYPNNEEITTLLENTQSDIKWEKINSIEKSKNKVYDFSLPDNNTDEWCHSVLYNGIIGHQTPQGMNHFHDTYRDAVAGLNNYYPITINWRAVPGRDDVFKENVIKDIGIMRWMQEFDGKFLGSTATLVDGTKISELKSAEPIEVLEDGCLLIYEKPIKGAVYVLGVDPGKGLGQDYSTIQILKIEGIEKIRQVSVYRNNKIDPHNFSGVVIKISQMFNRAFILVENNGKEGGMVIEAIHYVHKYDMLVSQNPNDLGISSNVRTKFTANMLMRRYVENNFLKVVDRITITELGKYEEVRPNIFKAKDKADNDDTITALIWGVFFVELIDIMGLTFDPRTKLITGGNYADTMYAGDNIPTCIIDDGTGAFDSQYVDEDGVVWR